MRYFLSVLFCFICCIVTAQQRQIEDINRYFKNLTQYGQLVPRIIVPKVLRIPDTTTADKPTDPGAIGTNGIDKLFVWDGSKWNQTSNTTIIVDSSGNIIRDTLFGGPFSSLPQVGFNPGNNLTPAQIIQNAFYASQVPTATLTGGQVVELMGAGADLPFTLAWNAGRSFATQPLASITVAGTNESFSQPPLNSSVSGTESVTVTRNINTSFANEVTTTDGKTTTATTSITFSAKRYAGWSTTNSPNDATILAGNINEFASLNTKTWTQPAPTTASFFYYAYPSSFGDLQHFVINGFESINSLTLTKRNLQNAGGYVQQYNIYVSNNQLGFGLSINAY